MIDHEQVEALRGHVAAWDSRDPATAHPEARAANTQAIAVIDAMFLELHRLRNHLISEGRVDDDLNNTRVDALLHRMRSDVQVPVDVQARIDAHAVDLSGFGVS